MQQQQSPRVATQTVAAEGHERQRPRGRATALLQHPGPDWRRWDRVRAINGGLSEERSSDTSKSVSVCHELQSVLVRIEELAGMGGRSDCDVMLEASSSSRSHSCRRAMEREVQQTAVVVA
jgi:hypothetical protein